MSSREKILEALRSKSANKGAALPPLPSFEKPTADAIAKFETILTGIGGAVVRVKDVKEIEAYVASEFRDARRVLWAEALRVTKREEQISDASSDPHQFENVDLVILQASIGVAENGAAWITDSAMPDRALPFIAQHIALVLSAGAIVPTLHDAYDTIGTAAYEFGTFIAGPSKTADIEQSLVLGAHGPKSMTVFLVG